ncbi:DNA methyltransferase [Gimesia sp.]|uniref:DNA methyltransferase n=1 Tax=Gimesia sp. TaxID=2024833 RepID=UPI0032ED7D52
MSIARFHAEWLSLLDISGPFLSLPVLVRRFPQGLEAHDPDHFRLLRQVHDEWDDNQQGLKPDPGIHTQWIKWVLKNTLELDDMLLEGQEIPQTLKAEIEEPQNRETLRPNMVLMDPDGKKARLLIQTYPLRQKLTRVVEGKSWKVSPDTRMTQLLRDTGVTLGLVTNGDQWMLVYAPKGETSGYTSWYSTIWLEEQKTLAAFRNLLGLHRFFGVSDEETLDALLAESAEDQQEVTDQLGYQVRKAVEVLVQSLDKADQDYDGKLLDGVPEKVLYEASLTVMMKLVFLFCAEERELLLLGDEIYDLNYAVSTLREQLRTTADNHGEEILESRKDAWSRLLTTFRAVYSGVQHERMKLPPYGGNLFNPDRFPFLEGREPKTSWQDTPSQPLPINNRTVLHLLEALQVLQVRLPGGGPAEPRKLSFSALDIEQIGHVYEGLLDHTAIRATEPVLGLTGTRVNEPEIPLSKLEELAEKDEKELHKFLKKETGRSTVTTIKKMLGAEIDDQTASRFRTACHGNEELWKRIEQFAGLVRTDTYGYPAVIVEGSVYVTAGTDRRSSGTHYTPKSLTEPIVQYTLEPLVYEGPSEGKPRTEWRLKTAAELLELKICDMACGSGAFLVQACRYLSERLLEAWGTVEEKIDGTPKITPLGEISKGGPMEQIIPSDAAERLTYARRIIAQRCLYGVDANPLAAEMAKLSLWLLTLAKDKPFEFLDHSIRCGDSLVGIHNLDQLKYFNLKPNNSNAPLFIGPLDQAVNEAIELRLKLEALPSNTVEEIETQEILLSETEEKLHHIRNIANLLVGAILNQSTDREERRSLADLASIASRYLQDDEIDELDNLTRNVCKNRLMFHWPLEFPEVLISRGGFDGFLGNPPYQGGTVATTALGGDYTAFISTRFQPWHGKADLVGAFLRNMPLLMKSEGTIGIVTTASLIRGETLESSLIPLVSGGSVIYRAVTPFSWPGEAKVTAVCVWLNKSRWEGSYVLDSDCVETIGPDLEPGYLGVPVPLATSQKGYLGIKLSPHNVSLKLEDMHSLPHECQCALLPAIGGQELYRNVNWSVGPFAFAPELVTDNVLSQFRKATNDEIAKEQLKHSAPAKALTSLLHESDLVLACAETTHVQLAFVEVPNSGVLLKHSVIVFPKSDWWSFAVLQSCFHVEWSWKYGIRRKQDLRYSPKRCSYTFPWPLEINTDAKIIGKTYHLKRQSIMESNNLGLTQLYNRFHDPEDRSEDIRCLRELHVRMDQCVAQAYGWLDLDLSYDFRKNAKVRYTIENKTRREILNRLLKLNHTLSEVEANSLKSPTTKLTRNKKDHQRQERTLFD